MYCDKYRKKLELAGAIRTARSRMKKERKEFSDFLKR